jgi:transmembrane sensor
MDFKNMLIKHFVRKLTSTAASADDRVFEDQIAKNPHIFEEYQIIRKIWEEAVDTGIFAQIDTESDWGLVRSRIGLSVPGRYHRVSWQRYFIRIAALVVLTFGLSIGFYKVITSYGNKDNSFTSLIAEDHFKDLHLPDGSLVTLNADSKLIYRNDFGRKSRDVILEGEALFSVLPDATRPFRVFINESVVEVTGTKFAVREEDGTVKVSVISGTVLLSSRDDNHNKISISANHSGYILPERNEIGVEDGIPVNTLSWKTGHLIFEETPIDSALIDIARHFRKELSFETAINEEITAEFQNQPLNEILRELELVAGLQFDTTRTTLIVRK